MEKIDSVKAEKMCTGCGACYNICPKKAISMPLNHEGFYEPIIDEALCTNCGACGGVCPVRNVSYENSDAPGCYAMMADDEVRAVSSSGGAFTLLAQMVLEKKGLVCGVAFSEDFRRAAFVTAETEQDLAKLRGSKYFMPETGDIYRKVKEALEKKRYVLFAGSPCHVAALKSFLGKQYHSEYLLTADLICHGIPSVKAFDHYMSDVHANKAVKYLSFRDLRGGSGTAVTIDFADGSSVVSAPEKDCYFKAFLNGLSKNSACGACMFAGMPRQGDFTIGDFWDISAYDKTINDGKGVSLVLVNSERGKAYTDALAAKSKLWKPVPLEYAVKGNPTLVRPHRLHPARERFFENIDKAPFDKLVTKCLDSRYDVGIVGLWYGINYGSILTYYALYCVINKMGFDALMINKPDSLWASRFLDKNTIAHRFIDARCDVSEIPKTFVDWEKLADRCYTFVLGSDVVWNYNVCGKQSGQFFFLDFVSDDKKKIAMASSFGEGYRAPESVREVSEYYLRKFDFVSVREDEAVKECAAKFGVKADKVLDPVFLCGREVFDELADEAQLHEESPYISSYILGTFGPRCLAALKRLTEVMKKPLKIIENPNEPGRLTQVMHLDCVPTPSVEEWLAYIRQSDFYVGDSFHGMCFALIFHVPFLTIATTRMRSANRFTSLLKMLHLEDRLLLLDKDNLEERLPTIMSPIDFEATDKILSTMADASYKWLYSALTAPKQYQIQPQDNIIKNLREQLEAQRRAAVSGRQAMFNEIKANAAYSGRKYAEKRNLCEYLDTLAADKDQLIIFIAVKDTPGMAFNQEMQARFQKLGLKCSLLNMHWHSYVAVIGAGKVFSEILSKKDERVAYEGKFSCGEVKVVSRSLNQGNIAYIGIHGEDYSENKRGFNIVVYDRVSGVVVDSVCFDTHDKAFPYYRFGKKFDSAPVALSRAVP